MQSKIKFNEKAVQTGTKITSGYLNEDYLSSANGISWMQMIDKMRRQDSEIKRMLRTLYLPILAANYDYNAVDDMDKEQLKQCDFKNRFWKKRIAKLGSAGLCNQTWREIALQMLNYVTFGYAVFQPVYHSVEDATLGSILTLKSLGMIHQTTIEKWNIKNNDVIEIYQNVTGADGVSKWIDADGLLIMTNEKEGDNFEGVSILRPVYGNYVRKDMFYKLIAIGAEKMAVGTPTAYVPATWLTNPNSKELLAVGAMLENYVSHEDAYIILPNSMKDGGFVLEKSTFEPNGLLSCIQAENISIMDSVLASFLNIGISKAGGNSQNTGQMNLFLSSLQSIADEITWVRDELVHQAYVMNFGEPKLRIDTTIGGITLDSAEKAVNDLRAMVTGAIVEPDEQLEKWVRNKWKLPPKDKETSRKTFSDPASMAPDKSVNNDFPTPDSERVEQGNPEDI